MLSEHLSTRLNASWTQTQENNFTISKTKLQVYNSFCKDLSVLTSWLYPQNNKTGSPQNLQDLQ